MKKIISMLAIAASLMVLVNCSPKSTGKTTKNNSGEKKSEVNNTTAKEEKTEIVTNKVERVEPKLSDVSDLPVEQQLTMYKDMAPLRVETGLKLCNTRCAKCHDVPNPAKETQEKWVKIMRSMGPKAKLSLDEYMMVAGYLVQNAKK